MRAGSIRSRSTSPSCSGKVLTPNDFADLAAVADRLRQFERHFAQIGQPFEWTFTRDDLANFLEKLDSALADAA